MTGPLGSFIDDFILLINELPKQHRMLIFGDFNLLIVVKVDPLIQLVPAFTIFNSYMGEYWIWYLILQNLILFLLCCHPAVINLFFFFKSDGSYLYRIYNPHYITHKYSC